MNERRKNSMETWLIEILTRDDTGHEASATFFVSEESKAYEFYEAACGEMKPKPGIVYMRTMMCRKSFLEG